MKHVSSAFRHSTRVALLLGAVALLAGAAGLRAAGETPAASPAPAPSAADAGMRAYLDPETGLVGGMPPSLAPGEVEGVQAAQPVLREEILPDGSVMLDLQGTSVEYMVLQLDPNGERAVRCVQDPKQALAKPAAVAKPEVK